MYLTDVFIKLLAPSLLCWCLDLPLKSLQLARWCRHFHVHPRRLAFNDYFPFNSKPFANNLFSIRLGRRPDRSSPFRGGLARITPDRIASGFQFMQIYSSGRTGQRLHSYPRSTFLISINLPGIIMRLVLEKYVHLFLLRLFVLVPRVYAYVNANHL